MVKRISDAEIEHRTRWPDIYAQPLFCCRCGTCRRTPKTLGTGSFRRPSEADTTFFAMPARPRFGHRCRRRARRPLACAKRNFVDTVEPVATLRSHTPVHARITSRAGRLPVLGRVPGAYDFIRLSAVWHTLPSSARPRGLACCARLLVAGGRIALSVRRGPGQGASISEIRSVARDLGLCFRAALRVAAQQEGNRTRGVSWDWVVLSGERQVRDGEASRPFR